MFNNYFNQYSFLYMRALLLFFVVICNCSIAQQEQLVIKGLVADKNIGISLPYAHIIVSQKKISAVSNRDGFFSFAINNINFQDSIIVSHVGYETYKGPITEFLRDSISVVKLNPLLIILDEIVIKPNNESLEKFIIMVNTKYNQNVRSYPHIALSYFCEKIEYNSKLISYVDGVGYSIYMGNNEMISPLANYKFFAENIRRSNLNIYEFRATKNIKYSEDNFSICGSSISLNAFRRFELEGVLAPQLSQKYKYNLDSFYMENDRMYYVVSYSRGQQKGKLVADADDYKIKYVKLQKGKVWDKINQRLTVGEIDIEFQYFENKPYVSTVKTQYITDGIIYNNYFKVLLQKLNEFVIEKDDLWAINAYDINPYVQYVPEIWDAFGVSNAIQFSEINGSLVINVLENQFKSNSGKWYFDNQISIDLRERAKAVIKGLKIFF